jgi:katanin p60 ATPase-containing subunit A1
MARHYAPSIIFIDEVDALASQRGAANEHEASRRLKSELLTQMDGVVTALSETNKAVVVLAATNHPWDLDEALRRRLEKRIHVPLPDEQARKDMINLNLKDVKVSENVDISSWASKTEGYSGDDIRILCREASMAPMRRLLSSKSPQEISALRAKEGQLELEEVTDKDMYDAFQSINPSVSDKDLENFQAWGEQFGSA